MNDLGFLHHHDKTRRTAGRAIKSLEDAGFSTLALCLQGGKEALTNLPYVTESTWVVIEDQADRPPPLVYDGAMNPGPRAATLHADGDVYFDAEDEVDQKNARPPVAGSLGARLNHVIRYLRGQCSDLPEVA